MSVDSDEDKMTLQILFFFKNKYFKLELHIESGHDCYILTLNTSSRDLF